MKKLTKLTLFEKHCEDRKQAIRKAKAIVDKDVVDTVKDLNIVNESSDFSIVFDQFAFLKKYDEWIHSSEKFKICPTRKTVLLSIFKCYTCPLTKFSKNLYLSQL